MSERWTAGDVCNRVVVVAERATTLEDAARRMREEHVGCLIVVEAAAAGRRVVGMLTDRDIVTGVVAKGLDPARLRLEDVMSTDVVGLHEGDSLGDAIDTMRRKGLRRLPVLAADATLIGLVTLDDVLPLLTEQMHALVQAITTEQRRERVHRR
jgi:CBS domain-containing protein